MTGRGTAGRGTAETGTAGRGPAGPGMSETGPARPGTAQTGPAGPGTVLAGPARPSPAGPGTARPGTARHGTDTCPIRHEDPARYRSRCRGFDSGRRSYLARRDVAIGPGPGGRAPVDHRGGDGRPCPGQLDMAGRGVPGRRIRGVQHGRGLLRDPRPPRAAAGDLGDPGPGHRDGSGGPPAAAGQVGLQRRASRDRCGPGHLREPWHRRSDCVPDPGTGRRRRRSA